ncbi:MAG: ECF transporter S component [Dermabacter sp.]|nr:ECF transporter S component [Dermabacter sp.]
MTDSAVSRRFRYRTIDLLVPILIGVAFGVAFWGYANVYTLLGPLTAAFPPIEGLLTGFWCLPALIAMLIVRKPGAALSAEVIAACLAAILGSKFGITSLYSGVIQGIGFEIAFAATAWRSVGWPVVIAGSLMSTFFEWVYEIIFFYPEWSVTFKALLLVFFWISALTLLAGLGKFLVGALARTGAINQFPPGREWARANAQ